MRLPRIKPSAYKHHIATEDIRHAFANPMGVIEANNGMVMYLGPDRNGVLLEVGIFLAPGQPGGMVIAHAMRMRPKFQPYIKPTE